MDSHVNAKKPVYTGEKSMPAAVTVKSVEGSKFEQEVQAGEHVLYGDESASVGGSDRGPSPYEYLLIALGT